MKPCRVCDDPYRTDGLPTQRAALRRILGPRWRATEGGFRDWICWQCVVKVARYVREMQRRRAIA